MGELHGSGAVDVFSATCMPCHPPLFLVCVHAGILDSPGSAYQAAVVQSAGSSPSGKKGPRRSLSMTNKGLSTSGLSPSPSCLMMVS